MKKMKSAFIQDTSLLLQAFEEEGFNNLQNISLSRVLEKFENILNEEDLVDATQMETIVKLLIESDIVSPNTDDMKLYNKLVKELKSKLTYWRKSLQVNDCFDSYHETDHKWYRVKILQKLSGNIFYIHYNGWPDKYNTEIDVSQENACYPCNYRVQLKKIKKESLPSDIPSIDDSIKVELEDTSIIIQPETAGNISGNNELTRLRADMNYKEHSKCVKREKKNVSYGEDSNDWICAICIDFETTIDEDELVLCDGVCKRSFHASCLKSKNMKLTNVCFHIEIKFIHFTILLLLCRKKEILKNGFARTVSQKSMNVSYVKKSVKITSKSLNVLSIVVASFIITAALEILNIVFLL